MYNRIWGLWTGLFLAALFAWGAMLLAQQAPRGPVIPIEGLDPVLLVQGKEVQGKESIAVVRGRFKYIFASDENKAAFERDPTQFEVSNYCQYMGPPTTGNPDLYVTHKGRIYLFGSENCVKGFQAAPDDYLEPALAPWNPSAVERARGQALLEKAVAAMGGAPALDGLASYREKRSQKAKRRDGTEYDATTEITRAFPDGLRQVQVRQFGTIVTAFAGQAGFSQFRDGNRENVRPALPEARALLEESLLTDPVFFLRARKQANFQAATLTAEPQKPSGPEIVHAQAGKLRFAAGIDPASGRLVSLSLVTRGPGGKFGTVAMLFSDYRAVGTLQLPHRVDLTFKGEPWADSSYSVTEMEVNKPVDPALFQKPALPATSQQ